MSWNSRRGLIAGFALAAAALMTAGTAYACTVYKGKVTFTPTGTGASGSKTAEGDGGIHTYCSGETRTNVTMGATRTFNLDIAPTTSAGCNSNQLDAGTYDVRYIAQQVNFSGDALLYNCNPPTGRATTAGQITVNASGSGSGSGFMLPAVGTVNVCVTNALLPNDPSGPELYLNVI